MAAVTVEEVLKTLAEWGAEECGLLCQSLRLHQQGPCRHARAAQAIVEVANAVAYIERKESV